MIRFAVICLLLAAGCQAERPDARLLRCVQQDDAGNLDELWQAVEAVNRAEQGVLIAPSLVALLEDRPARVRADAAWVLGELDAPPDLRTDGLLIALRDKEPPVRWAAAEALGKIGPTDPRIVTALVRASDDPENRVRRQAVQALAAMGPAAKTATPRLRELLQDAAVRRWAAQALGGIGPGAPGAAAALLEAAHDANESDRVVVAQALWNVTRNGKLVTRLSLDLLEEDVFLPVRLQAAQLVAEMGPEAKDAAPKLAEMLGSEYESAARVAAAALVCVGEPAIPWTLDALNSPEANTRQFATLALGRLSRENPEVLSRLIPSLRDESWLVRLTAAQAIEAADVVSDELILALRAATDDPHPFVRTAAAGALDRLAERSSKPKLLSG